MYGQYFNGRIDEVRVYRAALSQAEIQADMAAPLGGPPDTTVPSQVSGLAAGAVSSSRVDLSWSAASDNVGVTGYEVERCQGAGCSSFAAVTTVSGLTWSDTGRSAGTSYSYRVRARDAAGNRGAYSAAATAVTPAAVDNPPSAPSGLAAAASGSSGVNLSWTAATDDNGVVDRMRWSGVRGRAARGLCSSRRRRRRRWRIRAWLRRRATRTGCGRATRRPGGRRIRTLRRRRPEPRRPPRRDPGRRLRVRRGVRHDGGGSVRQRQRRHDRGATWITTGKYGKALNFNGTSARVKVPNATAFQLTSGMTLEAWVYPTAVNRQWRDVIYKGSDDYFLMATTTASSRPALGATFAGALSQIAGTADLPANTWTHVAGTYDGARYVSMSTAHRSRAKPRPGTSRRRRAP